MENKLSENVVEELLAWSKPEIKRLVVSFDTQNNTGSAIDGGLGSDLRSPS